ncbi:MAG: hypothetical protein FWF49_01690 [Oscillospiraceae bacterium]|nr:hypothetical protein [Oscillospiraceae bacterium]
MRRTTPALSLYQTLPTTVDPGAVISVIYPAAVVVAVVTADVVVISPALDESAGCFVQPLSSDSTSNPAGAPPSRLCFDLFHDKSLYYIYCI